MQAVSFEVGQLCRRKGTYLDWRFAAAEVEFWVAGHFILLPAGINAGIYILFLFLQKNPNIFLESRCCSAATVCERGKNAKSTKKMSMYCICEQKPRLFSDLFFARLQGDQMSLGKNAQNVHSLTPFCQNYIMHDFFRGKKVPKNLGSYLKLKNIPKC
jgi:hypothetical protein